MVTMVSITKTTMNISDILKKYGEENNIIQKIEKTNTVIEHTQMEKLIYKEKKDEIDNIYEGTDYTIDEIAEEGNKMLDTFNSIPQDLFNLLYKINPQEINEENLTEKAKTFNKEIIKRIKENDDYKALKTITEGKDYESIEGSREFSKYLYDNLDELLKNITGEKEVLNTIEKTEDVLEKKQEQLQQEINIYKQLQQSGAPSQNLESKSKIIQSLDRQVQGMNDKITALKKNIAVEIYKNKEIIDSSINKAVKKAIEKVEEVQNILDSFGTENGEPKTIEKKAELIKKVKSNYKFNEIAKFIGKMRKIAKNEIQKTYTSGTGEKIGIEYGNKISKVLPSEIALLTTPQTSVIFYKKLYSKTLKQYKERTEENKGRGHIIICGDESGSMAGSKIYWQKALAIAFMDIAVKEHRNFCYIPFGNTLGNVLEVNSENYNEETLTNLASSFLGGGTNFDNPLLKSLEILEKEQYENADIIFMTDGESNVSNDILEKFNALKQKKKVQCVGILMDKGEGSVSDITLKKFTDKIFKTSEFTEEEISMAVISKAI